MTIPGGAVEGALLAVWPCRSDTECDLGTCVDGQCAHTAAPVSRPYPTQADLRREGLEPHDRLHAFDLDGDGSPDAIVYVDDLTDDVGQLRDYPTALFLFDPAHRVWSMQHASEP